MDRSPTRAAANPRFIKAQRQSDGMEILLNLELVRYMEPINGGIRMHFGSSGQDDVDIYTDFPTINELLGL